MRRLLLLSATFAVVAFAFTACASAGTAPTNVTESSPDRITTAEIQATTGASTAYDLVRRLRPRWLQAPAPSSISGGRIASAVLLVYLDGNRLGTVDALRTLNASGIKTMQYYDAVRAQTVLREVGSEAISGAIVITTQ